MSNSQPILCEVEYDPANVQVLPETVEEIVVHDKMCGCDSCNESRERDIQKMQQELANSIKLQNELNERKRKAEAERKLQEENRMKEERRKKEEAEKETRMKEEAERKAEAERKKLSEREEIVKQMEVVRQKYTEQQKKYKEIQALYNREFYNLTKLSQEYYALEYKLRKLEYNGGDVMFDAFTLFDEILKLA